MPVMSVQKGGPTHWLTGWHLYFAVIAACLALSLLWTLPVWLAPNHLIGLPGDPVSNAWNAAWVPFALTHGLSPYQSAYLNAPSGINNMWPAPTMLYIILVWPLTMLISPTLGYNAIMVLALTGTGAAAFALMIRFTHRRWLAAWASGLFTFGPYEASEVAGGHPDLAAVGSLLLLALLTHELFISRNWKPRSVGLCIAALLLVQMVTSEEVLASAAIMAAIGTAIALLIQRKLDRDVVPYVCSSLKWAAVALPPMLAFFTFQWLAPGALHGQNASPSVYSAPLITYFIPGPSQQLSLPWTSSITQYVWGPKEELSSYLGVAVIVTLILGLRRLRAPMLRWLLAMLVVSAVLTLGPAVRLKGGVSLPAPEALLAMLPLVGNILPIRLGIYVDLFSVLAMVLVLDKVSWVSWVRYSAASVVALTWVPSIPAPAISIPVPSAFTRQSPVLFTEPHAPDVVLLLPYVANGATDAAMLWQAADHFRFRVPEGYWVRLTIHQPGNAYGPAATEFTSSLVMVATSGHVPAMNRRLRSSALAYLRSHDVGAIVLGPSVRRAQLERFVDGVLRARPHYINGVAIWRVN